MSDKPEESEYDPDEIEALSASEAGSVVDALDRNRNQILFLIAGSAVIICAVLVLGQVRKQKHLDAAQAYSTALGKGEIAGLDAVVVDFEGSIAAGNALLSKAEIQIDQGKPKDAQTTLETFVADYENHPRHVQGIFALGNLFHIAGDTEQARSYYQRAIDEQPDGEITPLARIRLGDLALEAGETKVADQLYQEAYTLHPGTPFFDYAEQKIALLAIGDPPVVERPEPPKPEPKAEAEKPTEAGPDTKPAPAAGKGKGKAKSQPKAAVPGNGKGKAKASGDNSESKNSSPKEKSAKQKSDAPKAKAEQPKANTPKPQETESEADAPKDGTSAPAPDTPEN